MIYGNEAETERARKFLSVLVSDKDKAFCVNYVWGILAAFESNWTESLAAFKQSSENLETAEIQYLIGAVYFQLEKYATALKYLQRAISLDVKFADA